ncbi:MAG: hypothetical protein EOO38_08715 [Cytophagaceae bacterium]|nr:MAG: hypothetical protein EOO38_08715 [Cytophagaceae bacterium]
MSSCTKSSKAESKSKNANSIGEEAIKQLVASSLGVAMVSVATIRDQISVGTIVVVPIRDLRIERVLWRLSVSGRLSNPATIAFNKLINL